MSNIDNNDTDDLISLLAAWEEAADGNWLAQKEVLLWLENLLK